jgi:hypothetical protein
MNKVSHKSSYEGKAVNEHHKNKLSMNLLDTHASRLCYSHEYIGDGTRILKGQEDKPKAQDNFFGV